MPHKGGFQYLGFAAPLPNETPPAPALSWGPIYPNQYLKRPALTAAILAGAFFFINTTADAAAPAEPASQTLAQIEGARIAGGGRIQYPSQVRPIYEALTPVVEPPFSWLPGYPDRISRILPQQPIPAAYVFEVVAAAADQGISGNTGQVFPDPQVQYPSQVQPFPGVRAQIEWLPTYPERITRPTVRAADQRASFTPTYLPIFDLRWEGSFPDRVWGAARLPVYPALAFDPYPIPAAEVVTYAAAYYPDRLSQVVLPPLGGLTEPPPSVRPLGHVAWLPAYPDAIYRPVVRAADQLAFVQARYLPIFDLRWQGTFPDQISQLRPQLLGGAVLDPYPIPTVAAVTYAAAYYPDRIARVVLPILGGLTEPPSSARNLGHVGWLPGFPDRIDRLSVRAADQQAIFAPRYLPIADLRWAPSYPDRIDRFVVRAADQAAFFPARYLPIFDLRWAPSYPDQIWAKARVVDYLAFVTGQTGSTIPYADLRWQGVFPSQIDRRLSQPHLWPVSVLDPYPLPNEPAPLLSWHPIFPDRIDRRVMLVNLIPFHDVRNLDPIPNEAVGGSHVITIGVEIGITDFPVLGGWVPF